MLKNADGSLSELHTKTKSSGLDLTDPALVQAWRDVRDDAQDTDWCLFGYSSKSKIQLAGKGGGFDGLQAALNDDKIFYGGIRLHTSKGVRFLFLAIIGDNVNGMAKGRAGMHKQAVYNCFEGVIGSVTANGTSELTADAICQEVKSLTGNCNTYFHRCVVRLMLLTFVRG